MQHASSCYFLGLLYANGHGVKLNNKTAMNFFHNACENGESLGCLNLGFFYKYGIDIEKNYIREKYFFLLTCLNGNDGGCKLLLK